MWQNGTKLPKVSFNGRFGVMAAVLPQTRQCKFESLYPAESLVKAATTPSRWDVMCNARSIEHQCDLEENQVDNFAQLEKSENFIC